jgi:hypothetical protein
MLYNIEAKNTKYITEIRNTSKGSIPDMQEGEIIIRMNSDSLLPIGKLYYVRYDYCNLTSRRNEFFFAILKKQKEYSYIFKDICHSLHTDLIQSKKCVLSVPKYWVECIDIDVLHRKLPKDILIHEILQYLL